jgi:hypothetical protein
VASNTAAIKKAQNNPKTSSNRLGQYFRSKQARINTTRYCHRFNPTSHTSRGGIGSSVAFNWSVSIMVLAKQNLRASSIKMSQSVFHRFSGA